MGSTEDGPEEKVPNIVIKQKRVVPKKRKRRIKEYVSSVSEFKFLIINIEYRVSEMSINKN